MIVKLHNLRIKTQLLLLCFVMLAGFIVFGVISFHAVTEIEVNGPVYQRIVQGKNLIADILPPPAYILESYLTMVQIGDETNRERQKILTKRLRNLREEYYERYRFWQKNLPDGPMKEIIIKKSHEPVAAFYGKFEKEFLPAVFSNDKNRIRAIRNELGRLYAVHRAAIDKLAVMARTRNSADEALAASIIRKTEILLIAVACAMMAAIAAVFLGVRQMLANNVFRLVSVTERFSSGDLTARSGFTGKDEFSEIGRAFDQMAEKIEQNSIALKKGQEELKRHRDSLEELVRERTGELAKANEQLEQKVEERTSQLIKAREELIRKEKLSVLGQLAGFVGHEIRNPLGVMNNAVYFLKTVMPDADDIVVDDDPQFCKTLQDILHARGYKVQTEINPDNVLDDMDREYKLVVLLDLRLGDKDGTDVLKDIRTKYPTKPVILITGYGEEMAESISKGLQIGAHACLYKPFEIEALIEHINEIDRMKLKAVLEEKIDV